MIKSTLAIIITCDECGRIVHTIDDISDLYYSSVESIMEDLKNSGNKVDGLIDELICMDCIKNPST